MWRDRSTGSSFDKRFKTKRPIRYYCCSLGGEMGRLPVIQFRQGLKNRDAVGRDHNTYGFSQWVAGGGFKGGYVHGKTDEFSHYAVEGTVNHYDWLATVLHLFGLDHQNLKYRNGPNDIRLVEESHARVIQELLS